MLLGLGGCQIPLPVGVYLEWVRQAGVVAEEAVVAAVGCHKLYHVVLALVALLTEMTGVAPLQTVELDHTSWLTLATK